MNQGVPFTPRYLREDALVDKRLFLGYPRVNVDDRVMFATLNSVFTYIGMELIGRSNLGKSALDVNVIDYKKIPIVNPVTLEEKLKKDSDFTIYCTLSTKC